MAASHIYRSAAIARSRRLRRPPWRRDRAGAGVHRKRGFCVLRRANRLAWTIARRRPCQLCMWTMANFGHCYGDATFVAYTSSVLEQQWLDNVARWQHDVCAHTSNATVKQLLDAVQGDVSSVVIRNATMLHDTLSYFTYALRDAQFLHAPIEPTMSLARDPRKCWNIWSENYVQSKAYLLPLSE